MSSLLKVYKPFTPGSRHKVLLNREVDKRKFRLKAKILKFSRSFGRNNKGTITVFTKGGGQKKLYRSIEFARYHLSGIVESIEYDPFRTANIARVFSPKNKAHYYILAPEKLKRGHIVSSSLLDSNLDIKIGNCFQLKELPIGSYVHNVTFLNSKKGFSRAAGCYSVLLSRGEDFCRVKMPSGKHYVLPGTTFVSLGILSNSNHRFVQLGKAGRNRWLGKRPSVRGVAMNPVDHPHGGGEGRTSGGRPSVTPWGKVAHGQPTKKIRK